MNLNACREELRSIIQELRHIDNGLKSDFVGIGQEMCGNCVGQVANHYQNKVLTKLNNVNQNLLADFVHGKS